MLRKANKTRSPINLQNGKSLTTIFGHLMRREKLEHLSSTGIIEEKCSTGKQGEKMLDGLTKWLKVGRVTKALKARRDRDACNVMISYSKEQST